MQLILTIVKPDPFDGTPKGRWLMAQSNRMVELRRGEVKCPSKEDAGTLNGAYVALRDALKLALSWVDKYPNHIDGVTIQTEEDEGRAWIEECGKRPNAGSPGKGKSAVETPTTVLDAMRTVTETVGRLRNRNIEFRFQMPTEGEGKALRSGERWGC